MVCKKPFSGFTCGSYGPENFCLPCLIRRRNTWVGRCTLETFLHVHNSFVTLTYEQGCLPAGGNLRKKDVQDWLKRLRERFGGQIRYYGCAEYGERTWRPHYHAILFGYPHCVSPPPAHTPRVAPCECGPCVMLQKSWGQGFTDSRLAERKSIQYVAGYVTKKLTKRGDPRLQGREPEFPFMSKKPGIGANAMHAVCEALTTNQGSDSLIRDGDVPSVLSHGGKKLPLGRYMKKKLREYYGFPERRSLRGTTNNTPDGVLLRQSQELCALQECYEADPKNTKADFHTFVKQEREQKILNLVTKHNIFKREGEL